MQPTLRAARRFTRLAVWAPREFIASSPGAFDTLITKHSRHIFRVFLHLRVFFLSILASTVFGSQIEFANACVCKCLELANRYEREASVVLTDHKSADLIGALDDFNVEMRKNFCKRFRKLWSLISAVGDQRLQKSKHARTVSRERHPRDLECRPDERWRRAGDLVCRQGMCRFLPLISARCLRCRFLPAS